MMHGKHKHSELLVLLVLLVFLFLLSLLLLLLLLLLFLLSFLVLLSMVRTCVRLEVGGTACQFTGWDGGEGSAPSPTYMSSALEVVLGGCFGYVGPAVVVVGGDSGGGGGDSGDSGNGNNDGGDGDG